MPLSLLICLRSIFDCILICPIGRLISAVKAPAYEAYEPHVQQRRAVGDVDDDDDDDERRPLANEDGDEAGL